MFWPSPVDRSVAGEIRQVVDALQQAGATAVTYRRIEIFANVLMFVPLGVLGVLAFARARWWLVPVGCLVLSILVELTQLAFISDRFASIVDVVANVTGALVGAALARVIRRPVSGSLAIQSR